MLGTRIAMLRKAADMSQAELAAALKISPSAIGMYEQGRREPSVQILNRISQILGVSLDLLVKGQPTNESEVRYVQDLLLDRVNVADNQLEKRCNRPFSREELAVLFAALLIEP